MFKMLESWIGLRWGRREKREWLLSKRRQQHRHWPCIQDKVWRRPLKRGRVGPFAPLIMMI